MHSDIHVLIHAYRAAELHHEAAAFRPADRPMLRQRMGWTMIELGLRLAQPGPLPARAARTA
ncbi:hypothetical protein ACFWFI_36835 [Streptomyces sp. NPDC060209]|uniref:hypothetical protein n=1 Tax=Streptomyces sp. NPDC060209 TaxID=3347073 RepID=UPI003651F335